MDFRACTVNAFVIHNRTVHETGKCQFRTSLQPSRPAIMRGMISVTEPQVWTMIGLMGAVFFGTMTLISTMFTRVVRSEIGGVRSEIGGVRSEIGGLRGEMNARFDAVNGRIDNLDRDVQFLMNREIKRDN